MSRNHHRPSWRAAIPSRQTEADLLSPRSRPRFALAFTALVALVLAGCQVPGEPTDATTLTVFPPTLSFDGTSEATITVSANGRWSVAPDVAWLEVSADGGPAGSTTLKVTVDRDGLPPLLYAGALRFAGAEELTAVPVSMRFPTVSGRVVDPEGGMVAGLRAAGADAAAAQAAADAELVPGEYLVLLNAYMAAALEAGAPGQVRASADPSLATYRAVAAGLAADHGVTVLAPVLGAALPVMVVAASDEAAARLAADGRVRAVEQNRRWRVPQLEPIAPGPDHDFGRQWHYDSIDLGDAWAVTLGEEEVVVAVIDTGFATAHSDLSGNLLPGYDFAEGDADPSAYDDCAGHGTHVAGTVAATWNQAENVVGVAPGVRLRPVKVGTMSGGVCDVKTDAVANALAYAAGHQLQGVSPIPPVDVINISLGGYGSSTVLEAAVEAALDAGVVVVAPAGNDGRGTVMYPAAYDGVIGVSATDAVDGLAYYSNHGPQVDFAAPGGDTDKDLNSDGYPDGVLSLGWHPLTGEDWVLMQGTSMAAPHVSGVVALVKSVDPELDAAGVMAVLKASARDLGPEGFDQYFGWGQVNAGAAVSATAEGSPLRFNRVTVRLLDGDQVVASTRARLSGAFDLGMVASGSYTLEAVTDLDLDGSTDDPGEFHASLPVTVQYTGDLVVDLDVEPR